MSNYNTQLQSNNTDLQQVLQNLQSTSASIGNEVDTQADLISQIKSMVDNLPEAGSGNIYPKENATVTIATGGIGTVKVHNIQRWYYDDEGVLKNNVISVGLESPPHTFQAAIGKAFLVQATAAWDLCYNSGTGLECYFVQGHNFLDGMTCFPFEVTSATDATLYLYDDD